MVLDWFRQLFGRWMKSAPTPREPTWIDLPGTSAPVPTVNRTSDVAATDQASDHEFAPASGARSVGFASAQSASAVSKVRERLASAFHPSTPTRDLALFAGREDALATLIEALEVQKLHVVVYGDRGLGKTSLLHIVSQLARKGDYLVSYATCGSDTGFDTVFRQVAADIPLRYHARTDPATTRSDESFAALLGQGSLDVPRVATLMDQIRGARLLVFLDEFDRAQSEQFRLQVAELVKALSDTAATVQLVIAGVASNLNALIRHIPSIRRNVIGLPLGPMRDEEVGAILARGAERSGLSFDRDASDRLIESCNGSPYLANLLGQHAGLSATANDRTAVTLDDARAAVRRGADELRLRLSSGTLSRISRLSPVDLADLIKAATVAMRNVGRINPDDLSGHERFGLLLETGDHGDEDTLRFAEESSVPFLWLSGLSTAQQLPGAAEFQPIARA